jgi:hypothetical protein
VVPDTNDAEVEPGLALHRPAPTISNMSAPRPLAVVAGASSRIGQAIAEALASREYNTALLGRDVGRLEAARVAC